VVLNGAIWDRTATLGLVISVYNYIYFFLLHIFATSTRIRGRMYKSFKLYVNISKKYVIIINIIVIVVVILLNLLSEITS